MNTCKDLFKRFPDTRVMFKNSKDNIFWPEWKMWKDCSAEEQKQANLRELFPTEIILDLEEKTRVEEIKKQLKEKDIKYTLWDTGSRGVHFHMFFLNMPLDNIEYRKKIRQIFIKKYDADMSKASEKTLISIENKPHHKTMNKKVIMEKVEGDNLVPTDVLQFVIKAVTEQKENQVDLKDEFFNNYHTVDPFFNYIKSNVIEDGKQRNDVLFPNIAIGLVKEGLSKEEIDKIMMPIIDKNFPGKNYNEFEGWLNKAINGEIQTYNQTQINIWSKENTVSGDFYDLEPIVVEESIIPERDDTHIEFHWDHDLKNLKIDKVEWLIKDWVPVGDICFVAGKAASFKSTTCLHFGFCISEGLLVFNKYPVKKSKVLYINEENSSPMMISTINRVKKGLGLHEISANNIAFTLLQNITFDNSEYVKQLIHFINENEIRVLVFDSFRRFFLGDENDATLMNKLFNFLKYLRSKTNTTIFILHHLKKTNIKNPSDIRDLLRGSSDIVNSADSVIGIHRTHGFNAFKIEHIKNRAGLEMDKKLILIDNGEGKDMSYLYESDKDIKEAYKTKSAPEKCVEDIVRFLNDKQLSIFTKKDILNSDPNMKNNTLTNALNIMIDEGTITSSGYGKTRSFIFNDVQKTTK